MTRDRGRIVIVEDDPAMREVLQATLGRRGFRTSTHATAAEALAQLGAAPCDAVVTDLNMPGVSGIDLCCSVVRKLPDVPVILITAFGSLETAIQAIRAGAYDFVTKPLDADQLALALDRAVALHGLRREIRRLRDAIDGGMAGGITGDSPSMRQLRDLVARTADTESPVLITGETGTGKDVVARELHRLSRRGSGPFVAINCAALPDELLEAELSGRATEARARGRKGPFPGASGGTLLLDEVGDMPLALQGKLLRALEERRVRPVGSDEDVPFDARILAATNQDLETAVKDGRFRGELLYRLDVIRIEVPPLRARGNDILLLAQHFIRETAQQLSRPVTGLASDGAACLLAHRWPGNVRELRNVIERAVAVTRYDHIIAEDLPDKVRSGAAGDVLPISDAERDLVPLEEIERRHITRVLKAAGGNRTVAARVLGLDRKTLYRKLLQYESQ